MSGSSKWTFETAFEEAKKYETKMQFAKSHDWLYKKCLKNKWIEHFTWFHSGTKLAAEKRVKWNRETCFKEAQKYSRRVDFKKQAPFVYKLACENKWMNDYTWMPRLHKLSITFEECKECAAQCSSVHEFSNKFPSEYNKSLKEKWMPLFNLSNKFPEKLTFEYCKEIALKYKKLKDFTNEQESIYKKCLEKKWLKEFTWLERVKYKTYEECFIEAQKYNSSTEFKLGSPSYYTRASSKKWIRDYNWFQRCVSNNCRCGNRKWTYETCLLEAKKYDSILNFSKGSKRAFLIARKNGWATDYTFFDDLQKNLYRSKKIYTYEYCKNRALQYKTLHDLLKNDAPVYNKSLKMKWLQDFTWLERPVRWDYNSCLEESKKYKTRSEFCAGSCGAYTHALNHKWLDDFYWLKRPENIYSMWGDNVYVYIFESTHSVYIGRTLNPKERDSTHRTSIKSAVFKHSQKMNIPIPSMQILKTNLSMIDGVKFEDFYVKKYKSDGWSILNKAPTGEHCGALGSLCHTLSYQKCLELAQTCKTSGELKRKNPNIYHKAMDKGWLYEWFDVKRKKRNNKPNIQYNNQCD